MKRLKSFLWSVVFLVALVAVLLLFARVVGTRELNEKWLYYGRLELGIRELCTYGTEEQLNRASAVITKANREIEEHREFNRSGSIADLVTPDAWDSVGFISIPTEMECARTKTESRIRQCILFKDADWREQYDEHNCDALLAAIGHPAR